MNLMKQLEDRFCIPNGDSKIRGTMSYNKRTSTYLLALRGNGLTHRVNNVPEHALPNQLKNKASKSEEAVMFTLALKCQSGSTMRSRAKDTANKALENPYIYAQLIAYSALLIWTVARYGYNWVELRMRAMRSPEAKELRRILKRMEDRGWDRTQHIPRQEIIVIKHTLRMLSRDELMVVLKLVPKKQRRNVLFGPFNPERLPVPQPLRKAASVDQYLVRTAGTLEKTALKSNLLDKMYSARILVNFIRIYLNSQTFLGGLFNSYGFILKPFETHKSARARRVLVNMRLDHGWDGKSKLNTKQKKALLKEVSTLPDQLQDDILEHLKTKMKGY